MTAILDDELERTAAAWDRQTRDSRLGHEWEQYYFHMADVLAEKIKQVRGVLDDEILACQKQHGLWRDL